MNKRLTYLNQNTEATELTQFEDDYSWQELIENADTVDQIFMHNAIDKLYEYEEAEEKGYIFKFSCKIGDIIYHPSKFFNKILQMKVKDIVLKNNEIFFHVKNISFPFNSFSVTLDDFGKIIFIEKKDVIMKLEM